MYLSNRSIVLSLALLLCAVSAFPQAGVASIDHANQVGEQTMRLMREKQIFAVPTLPIFRILCRPRCERGAGSARAPDA
jgi:hypothetical protein